MNDVRHRSRGQAKQRPARADASLLLLPEAQDVIARIAAAVDPDFPGRLEHIERVAAVAVAAKKAPRNPYAAATL